MSVEKQIQGEGSVQPVIHLPDDRQREKKVTRGSEKRQRSDSFLVRVHPADGVRLREDAAAAKLSVAGYLASGRLDDEAARRPRMRRASVDVTALTAAVVSFNRQQSNYNQAVRAINTLALAAQDRSSSRLVSEVEALRIEIERLQGQFAEPIKAILAALNREREG